MRVHSLGRGRRNEEKKDADEKCEVFISCCRSGNALTITGIVHCADHQPKADRLDIIKDL